MVPDVRADPEAITAARRARPYRVAFINTHPIQYFAPLYRMLDASGDLQVSALYLSDFSVRGATDRAFGRVVRWDVDMLNGYDARFVAGASQRGEPGGFFSVFAPGIWGEVRRGQFDALIVHGHTPAAHVLAIAAAKSVRTPVFMRGETHLGLVRGGVKAVLRRPLMGGLYRSIAGVLAIGTANAAFYRAMGVAEPRIFSMPYTIDNARFIAGAKLDADARREVRRELGVDDIRPIILYVAKFQRRKRPDDLIRAARRLEERGHAFQVVMVGSGEMDAELRALATGLGLESIHFAGFVNQSRLPQVYSASDVFVLPSSDEPWGLAINEAMCAGLPIVASREVGCGPDLVREGVNGASIRAGDIVGLASALAPLLQSDELRACMGQASREIVSRWSYEECRQGLLAALDQTVGRRSDG